MLGLSLVLLGLVSAGEGEVLRARAQGLLYQNPMAPYLPGVQPLLSPRSYSLGCGAVTSLLQDHCLKDNEPLQVTHYVPHPAHIFHQGHHDASPNLPA